MGGRGTNRIASKEKTGESAAYKSQFSVAYFTRNITDKE